MRAKEPSLLRRVDDLLALVDDHPDLAQRLHRVRERLELGTFHVVAAGEFKRGKSTLLNALLGSEILPTGVVPVTAVATELSFGPPGVDIELLDGTVLEVDRNDLADYVTEDRNPGNERKVARVRVRARSPLLETGLVLVDTPGLGSVFEHDAVAHQAYADADGAIIVLAADMPLARSEQDALALFSQRPSNTFIALNRADHLAAEDREAVRTFVRRACGQPSQRIWLTNAAAAVERACGRDEDADPLEFDDLHEALTEFVERGLEAARGASATFELERVTTSLVEAARLELTAAELDAADLDARIDEFQAAVSEIGRAFDDDVAVLRKDARNLGGRVAEDAHAFSSDALRRRGGELTEAATTIPKRDLDDLLRGHLETIVREEFDAFLEEEGARVDDLWREITERFSRRTRTRIAAVRAAAADIFEVELPEPRICDVSSVPAEFFYLFVPAPRLADPLLDLGRLAMPKAMAQRRAARRAEQELARELDKHAGRARHDLSERIDQARRDVEGEMQRELSSSTASIRQATERARALRSASADAEAARRRHLAEVLRAADDAADREGTG